jgi:lipopolysaccharide transport system permease protein
MTTKPPFKLILEPNRANKNYWNDLFRYKELFYILSWRDLKVRYKQTVLGIAWSVLRPLIMVIIFALVFGKAAGLKADNPDIPYVLFVFAAILPWQFFSTALSEASSSLIGNANLISKVYFPRLIIPASAVITSMVDFLITLVLMLCLFVYFQYIPSKHILFLPFFIVLAFFCSFGIGLFITALNVKYRDFRYIIPFIVQAGLYISPVGFSSQVLLNKLPNVFKTLFMLNPMVGVIDGFRWCFFDGAPLSMQAVLVSCGVTGLFMVLGVRTFRKMESEFADII